MRHGNSDAAAKLLEWGADPRVADAYGNDAASHLAMGRDAGLHASVEASVAITTMLRDQEYKSKKGGGADGQTKEDDAESTIYDVYCIQGMQGADDGGSADASIPVVDLQQRAMPTRLERLLEEQKGMSLAGGSHAFLMQVSLEKVSTSMVIRTTRVTTRMIATMKIITAMTTLTKTRRALAR